MSPTEFSSQFEILYNSIASNMASPVDEYEKSVFLTQAQRDLVVDIYTGRIESLSFESTEEAREYLTPLLSKEEATVEHISGNEYKPQFAITEGAVVSEYSSYPKDMCYITMEYCTVSDETDCMNGKSIPVIPVKHDEFLRILENPFRGLDGKRVLRVNRDKNIFLYSKKNLGKYVIDYIRNPSPIITEDLHILYGESIDIEGKWEPATSELPEVFHREILSKAVALAQQAYLSQNTK